MGDMSGMNMATTSMDMPMSTTSTGSMSTSTTSSMAMSMAFANSPYSVPILFSSLQPNTPAQAFGIWLGIFFTAIFYRGLVFLRTYLEAKYWSPPANTNVSPIFGIADGGKDDARSVEGLKGVGYRRSVVIAQPFSLPRDFGRCLLVFVTAMFAYALMLVTMSFVVAWFFAVITGLAFGELVFARLTAGRTVMVAEACH